ncbi:hypothetical protein CAPTEDRAFT_192953 [Capitella teleta]|uniref:Uncharacterized protein n=1 Tax=Capitella teleta TaxID=283909 RepID=R7TLH0_CAPTE|nr:hypothetical protein CAPTEDRAFT_192953 [Capitella teleta]|eukprot:ELT94332.1 hypothetical protein CAPTEDRAFT_192953 [Capitella teleta]
MATERRNSCERRFFNEYCIMLLVDFASSYREGLITVKSIELRNVASETCKTANHVGNIDGLPDPEDKLTITRFSDRYITSNTDPCNRSTCKCNKEGYKYVIRGDACNGIRTEEVMRKMCLPEGAKLKGHFRLGIDIPADFWEFQAPHNVTMKTLVLRETCIPVSEEVYMAKGGYASMTSTTYMDVSLGIKDRSVFDRPADCEVDMMSHYEDYNHVSQKRFDGHDSVLKALEKRTEN